MDTHFFSEALAVAGVVLIAILGVLGTLSDYKDPRTKEVTSGGILSVVAIVIVSVATFVATIVGATTSSTSEPSLASTLAPTTQAAAIEPHFTPAPSMPHAPPVRDPREFIGTESMGGGGPTVSGQVFTADRDGYLSELRFGPQSQRRESTAKLTVELWRAQNGQPAASAEGALVQAIIPASEMQAAGAMNGKKIRIDLRPAHIHMKKGEQLTIVMLPGTDAPFQFELVNGKAYAGGSFCDWREQQWKDVSSYQLRFQVFAAPEDFDVPVAVAPVPGQLPLMRLLESPSVDQPPRVTPTPTSSDAFVLAENMPRKTPIAPAAPPKPALPPKGEMQATGAVFEHDGSRYLEVRVFNGTSGFNRPGFPPMMDLSNSSMSQSVSVVLTHEGDPSGRVVYPSAEGDGMYGRMPYSPGMSMMMPGQGSIRQFLIASNANPLAPGRYTLTVVFPANIFEKTLVVPLVVPEPEQ